MIKDFQDYLLRRVHIRDKYVPYYVKWVSDCYSFLDVPMQHNFPSDQKNNFLKHLAKKHEDWQGRQADYALRLYSYFLTHLKKDTNDGSENSEALWNELEKDTRKALRLRHRSLSTEKTYVGWLRSFRSFLSAKQPLELNGTDIRNFLSYLAVDRKVSPSTQNQALNAIIFVFKHVLEKDVNVLDAVRARPKRRLPTVLSVKEIEKVFDRISKECIVSWLCLPMAVAFVSASV